MNDAFLKSLFSFSAPEPSLCDSCSQCGTLPGGSVTIGSASGLPKTYAQRYCGPRTVAIHTSGYQECEFYLAKETTP